MKVFARGEKKLKLKIWDVGEEAILINKEQFVSWFRCLTVGGSSGEAALIRVLTFSALSIIQGAGKSQVDVYDTTEENPHKMRSQKIRAMNELLSQSNVVNGESGAVDDFCLSYPVYY
ncbi:hypothetical protein C5167_006705 [Papaver somniferum]|uniref:Uncharacterized protein n=1 Tax=Papaver somniferum TaxID=3469 RepID=A0A4Y7JIB8_PAPSO|nr:hypothetical protein C5167_006705 [Papaver somniferum]